MKNFTVPDIEKTVKEARTLSHGFVVINIDVEGHWSSPIRIEFGRNGDQWVARVQTALGTHDGKSTYTELQTAKFFAEALTEAVRIAEFWQTYNQKTLEKHYQATR